ncbi:MAG: hypothetical protein CMJ64_20730 [Planctomycetaceae bacterium]|nr:hypothetical protein [Planctomycetaceae bacterium]
MNHLDDWTGELPLELARPYVQHNVFLALLTQTGLVGLGLWLMTLGLWAHNAWQLWTSKHAPLWARQHGLVLLALLIVYCVNGMFHDIGIITMVNMLLFLVAGVCQGLTPHIEGATNSQRPVARQRVPVAAASGA